MPTVPIPQVALQGGQSPGLSTTGVVPRGGVESEQMQKLGEATMQAGVAIGNIASGLQNQLDDARTKEAYTNFASDTMLVLEDPKTGYLNKVGKDAAGYHRARALDAVDKKRKLIEEGLDNDVQRGMFRAASDRFMIGVTGKVYGHEAEQFRVYSAGQSKAMGEQAGRDAVNAWMVQPPPGQEAAAAALAAGAQQRARIERQQQGPGTSSSMVVSPPGQGTVLRDQDPQATTTPQRSSDFELHKNTAIGQANKFADLQGWGKDDPRRSGLVLEQTTKIHAGVVDALVKAGRYGEALSYVRTVDRAEVDPTAFATMDAVTRKASEDEQGAILALELTRPAAPAEYDPSKEEPEDFLIRGEQEHQVRIAAALATLDKRFEAKKITVGVRDSARAEISTAERARQEVLANAGNVLMDEARSWLAKHPLSTPKQLPPATLVAVRAIGKEAELVAFARNNTIVTDQAALLELDALRDSGKFTDLSFTQLRLRFRGRLDDQDWGVAQALHAQALGSRDPKHAYQVDVDDRIKEAARVLNVLPRTSGSGERGAIDPEKTTKWFDFRDRAADLIQLFEQTELGGKRKASPKEVQSILDAAVLDEVWVDTGWDKRRSVLTLAGDNPLTRDVDENEMHRAYVIVEGEKDPVYLKSIPVGDEFNPGPAKLIPARMLEHNRRMIAEGKPEKVRAITQQAIAEAWVHEYKKTWGPKK